MRSILVFSLFLFSVALMGQTKGNKTQLAYQYYNTGEYEKAGDIYLDLYNKTPRNYSYFNRYIDCLLALEDFSTAEGAIKKKIKSNPNEIQLYTTLGNLLERQEKEEEANKIYTDAIQSVANNQSGTIRLGQAFVNLKKYDLAIQVYERGMEITAPKDYFSTNLANTYRRKGDYKNAVKYYLVSLRRPNSNANSLKSTLGRILDEDGMEELKVRLYEEIQKYPDEPKYPDFLQWVFEQQRDYGKALRQARALDRRFEETGKRIFDLSNSANKDEDFATAIKGYQYIVDNKGSNSSFYFESKQNLLVAKMNEIISDFDFEQSEFVPLSAEYDTFLLEFGKNAQTALVMMDQAELKATYMDDTPGAISLLEEIIDVRGINKSIRAIGKLRLADYYLIEGEIWEATLLYSQVDKDFKEEQLGEKARFKNAMFSYFNGEFEWAQEQFDILKAATSRLISNDAIDMSVFITDNMGLDTTDVPLRMFADADLLIFQNKYDQAFTKLDSITTVFPEHTLLDDILYKKAQIYVKQKNYNKAIAAYNKIIETHNEEIRCDNAIYELAALYELHLDDPAKAEELYKTLFIDFSNSTLAVDARKKYRLLRGDNIQ
jgi:tetratricopeptide (TPR) repeat protein